MRHAVWGTSSPLAATQPRPACGERSPRSCAAGEGDSEFAQDVEASATLSLLRVPRGAHLNLLGVFRVPLTRSHRRRCERPLPGISAFTRVFDALCGERLRTARGAAVT